MNIDITLGVASAATQIEGGGFLHTWSDWHQKGHIKDGSNPARANDHLNRWKEDIDMMSDMNIKIYRLSIEWARIEPEKGVYDEEAVKWYRRLLEYLKSKKISPLLTIHHFTNPLWFENDGGFAEPKNISVFLGFVEYVIRKFSDLADEFVTINEPNVFAVMGYNNGEFPPGKRSMFTAIKVQSIMATCHVLAYNLIHKLRNEMGYKNTKVGFAHHARVFVPKNKFNLWHSLCACLVSRMFQDALTHACLLGRFIFPLKKYARFVRNAKIKSGCYADFLGLNYYTRSTVSSLADGMRKDGPHNDLGWEIYPQGIAMCAADLYKLLKKPIYITENGTCDNNDSFRSRYIYDHLKALVDSRLPVERYYHWCFTDNFEWCEGESARFGLVHVDYQTQKRSIKNSGRFYNAMIINKGITKEIYEEFVALQTYNESEQNK